MQEFIEGILRPHEGYGDSSAQLIIFVRFAPHEYSDLL